MMKISSLIIVLSAVGQRIVCFENAYDLAEQRNFHRRIFEEPRSYKTGWDNLSPLARTNSVKFKSNRQGNGYDNIGSGGVTRYRQRNWSEFLTPQRANSFAFPRRNSFYEDGLGTFRSSERFHNRDFNPFRTREDFGFVSRANDDAPPNYSLRRSDVLNPFEEDEVSRRSDFIDRPVPFDWAGEMQPGHANNNFPRISHFNPARRVDMRKTKPIPSLSRQRPAFYSKNYFVAPRDSLRGSGGTTYASEKADENFQSATGGADDSVLTEAGSYVSSNEDQEEKKSDAGYHDDKKGAVLDVATQEKVGEATRFDKNGGNKSTIRVNKTSKKGHTTKGFATHHHKDETGNTTTFFDESSDTGGQEDYQDQEDEFGTRRTMELLNGREDGRFFKENGGRTGKFGSGIQQDKTKVEKDIVAKNNRFMQEEAFGKEKDYLDRGFKSESEYLGGGIWGESN